MLTEVKGAVLVFVKIIKPYMDNLRLSSMMQLYFEAAKFF